ncbi:MAG: UDP-N-acetylmuramate--L-alanine ligase [Thermoanaerobaculaceae bacterium]
MRESCQFYLLPIGGIGTTALAGLLTEKGFRVAGVDSALYPPASDLLAQLPIRVRLGFEPSLLPLVEQAVVIGNAVPASNPEVQEVLRQGLPYLAQAQCLGEFFCRGKKTVVVAGTHGKTTTTALTTHVFTQAGLEPTAFIGGVPRGGRPWRLGKGEWTVVEGDEYNTAFFDKGPKFLHYYPFFFVANNVEFDHGDLYPSLEAILAAFRAGVARVGSDGWVIANADDEGAREVAKGVKRVVWYGTSPKADVRCLRFGHENGELTASLRFQREEMVVRVPLVGHHNLANVLACVAASLLAGIAPSRVQEALASFPGVRRRLDILGEAQGITVVDDFAHHPTAVKMTLEGARFRFPGRRIVVAFEPRSLTAGRKEFFPLYQQAFRAAEVVILAPFFHRNRLAPDQLLDRQKLVRELAAQGIETALVEDGADTLGTVLPLLRPGDVFIAMSSGDFGNLPVKVLRSLRGEVP